LIGTAPAKRLDRGLAHQLFGGGQVDLDHAVLLEQAAAAATRSSGPGSLCVSSISTPSLRRGDLAMPCLKAASWPYRGAGMTIATLQMTRPDARVPYIS